MQCLKPRYKDWLNMPTWYAWEAVMLFCGIHPDDYLSFDAIIKPLDDLKYNPEVLSILEVYPNVPVYAKVFERGIRKGDFSEYAARLHNPFGAEGEPLKFIQLAKQYDLVLPEELIKIASVVFKSTANISIAINPPGHDFYSKRLAAAMDAWLAISNNPGLLEKATPKEAITKWLQENKKQYSLSQNAIKDIATIVNWKKGGPVIAPGNSLKE